MNRKRSRARALIAAGDFGGQRVDRRIHEIDRHHAQITRHARLARRLDVLHQRSRIAAQVAGIGRKGQQRLHDPERLARAGLRQRPGKRPPARIVSRPAGWRHPLHGRLRVAQPVLVGGEVLDPQRAQRLAVRLAPQQEAPQLGLRGFQRGRRQFGVIQERARDLRVGLRRNQRIIFIAVKQCCVRNDASRCAASQCRQGFQVNWIEQSHDCSTVKKRQKCAS